MLIINQIMMFMVLLLLLVHVGYQLYLTFDARRKYKNMKCKGLSGFSELEKLNEQRRKDMKTNGQSRIH